MSRLLGFDAALWLSRKRRKHAFRAIQTLAAESVVGLTSELRLSLLAHGYPDPWAESSR